VRNHHNLSIALILSACLAFTACGKKSNSPEQQPAAQAASETKTNVGTVAAEEDPEVVKKREAMEFALAEDAIKNDPKGQWAVSAKASSTYSSKPEDTASGYHAFRATGAPDTATYSDNDNSWATKEADAGLEWIELEYAKPVNASAIKIRQNNAPGAIISVDIYDETGSAHNIWKGPDATQYKPSTISWLTIPFEKTAFKTQRVKITLATNAVSGWNEIDAVQLIGE
jgi:hypothetical protein